MNPHTTALIKICESSGNPGHKYVFLYGPTFLYYYRHDNDNMLKEYGYSKSGLQHRCVGALEIPESKYPQLLYKRFMINPEIRKNISYLSEFVSIKMETPKILSVLKNTIDMLNETEKNMQLLIEKIPQQIPLEVEMFADKYGINDPVIIQFMTNIANNHPIKQKQKQTKVNLLNDSSEKRKAWINYAKEVLDGKKYNMVENATMIVLTINGKHLHNREDIIDELFNDCMPTNYMTVGPIELIN